MKEDFVTYDLAVKLKEKGFNEKCLFAYNDEQVINPKVVEEYGNLSDDGYYELTEDGGGKLKWDNVYIYEQQIIFRDKIIIKRNFVDAPTISHVLKWLRQEKKILVEIALSPEGYRHIIYTGLCCTNTSSASYFSFDGFYNHENNYITYEQAALAGIEYVIDNLI